MSTRNIFLTLAIIAVVALGSWGIYKVYQSPEVKNAANTADQTEPSNQTKPTDQAQPTNSNKTAMNNTECQRNFDEKKLQTAVNLKNQFVTLDVKNFGTIKVQLYDQDAPKTVENFLKLTNSGYYDCLTFHRVAKGFVIQGGDPNGNGTGGFSAFGAKFADELNPNTPSYQAGYLKGVLAMANSGPDTNGSQFFIMLADNPTLPKNYTIFGKVVAGQDVVDKIGQVEIKPGPLGSTDGSPVVPVVITKATITQ
jgi:cyclophilin family peptidyl-prolyl cis-trans isomerase